MIKTEDQKEDRKIETYGVPRDIYSKVKIVGLLLRDIALLLGSFSLAIMLGTRIFPKEQALQLLLFIVWTPLTVGYLLLPHNGGKRNYGALYVYLRRRKKRYISLDFIRKGQDGTSKKAN
ncbi:MULTISPECIES: DUF5592 family protein [unclassified Streptococcus]|uniref:DUF5592 family protein n=1 Tax=unclassified Streptococcus TaxID=2608887 RepID=UPI00211B68C0|nr:MULTISPECIES: DUF5592 family protein [unclassified Streptococcus]MCQ9212407.1 DUF5592 family protein [Streptococcus sp. B01]MCQ9213746.1 DUF5592 family protein [Streptococcus sp. O1]MCQ9214494.1 DUF5592 family protein [Streptococcus sp. O1]